MTDYKPLTPGEIEAAERLCREATPGDWEAGRTTKESIHAISLAPYPPYGSGTYRHKYIYKQASVFIGAMDKPEDARFIAAAHNLLPRLLAQVEALTAERDAALRRAEAAARILRKFCQGRRCTDDPQCPLGTFHTCGVPRLVMGIEGWGPDNTEGGHTKNDD